MYRGSDSGRRAAEVSPKSLLTSPVRKKNFRQFEKGAYECGQNMEVKSRRKVGVKKEGERGKRRVLNDRGEGCLDCITELCPSYGRVYSTAPHAVFCNVLCNVLAVLLIHETFSVFFFSGLLTE